MAGKSNGRIVLAADLDAHDGQRDARGCLQQGRADGGRVGDGDLGEDRQDRVGRARSGDDAQDAGQVAGSRGGAQVDRVLGRRDRVDGAADATTASRPSRVTSDA